MDKSLTILVDASSLIYRALFSTPDTVQAPDGTPMNAARGFLQMLARLIVDHDPDYIACATDEAWRPEWRVKLIETYKAYRAEPGSAQEQAEERLAPQMPVIFRLLELCGIQVVGLADYEAEDVIGSLLPRAPGRVGIVSGDRDLFQLVRDPNVVVLYPKRGVSQVDIVNEAYIEEHYGIPPRAYRDFAVLRGDPSDGLPGVRGVGEKIAASLLARYGSIEGILESGDSGVAVDKVRNQRDYVERALEVVTIPFDLPLPKVNMKRPRRVRDKSVHDIAKEFGLSGAVRTLAAAIQGPPSGAA